MNNYKINFLYIFIYICINFFIHLSFGMYSLFFFFFNSRTNLKKIKESDIRLHLFKTVNWEYIDIMKWKAKREENDRRQTNFSIVIRTRGKKLRGSRVFTPR